MKIFTKTCRKDFEWLKLAFRSVSKRAKEEIEWTVAVELQEHGTLVEITSQFPAIKFTNVIVENVWPDSMQIGNGYLRQQWVKMNAHKAMGRTLFWNWDSDVIAVRHFTHDTFMGKSGRPIYWFSPYNDILSGISDPSQRRVYDERRMMAQAVFGWPANFEWMRCMPIPMFGEILENGATTEYWSKMHGLLVGNAAGFSEFNLIGEYAKHFFPDAFEWRNAETHGPTWAGGYTVEQDGIRYQEHATVSQMWSWGGIPNDVVNFVGAMK